MIVGFTITDFKGHEKEAVEFIQKMCILDSPDIAQNIVNVGTGVNVYSNSVTREDLLAQPFSTEPIEVREGKFLLISAVNFDLELLYNGNVLRLVPTEYIYVEPDEISQFAEYSKQGLVRVIPEILNNQKWILAEGSWNDNGIWVDSDYWRDSNE